MTKSIVFTKMAGHGNDFIVIDNRKKSSRDWAKTAQKWCARRTGIGADGILLIENSKKADFTMRIINADGSEAEMCGNGARCAAAFALKNKIAKKTMKFETLAGIIEAVVEKNFVSLKMTEPKDIRDNIKIKALAKDMQVFFINTGVPHTIVFTDALKTIPVDEMGRVIRFHKAFAPAGTNVDFVQKKNKSEIHVRTYERGVEAETLACGTGAVASAITSARIKNTKPPIQVHMPGGTLIIDFTDANGKIKDIWFKGEVDWIYQGQVIDG